MINWPWKKKQEREVQSILREMEADSEALDERLRDRLSQLEWRIVAVHSMELTSEILRRKIEDDPHYTALSLEQLLELVEQLYVIDIWVSDAAVVPLLLGDVTQDNEHGQAPYGEIYFDEEGNERLFSDLDLTEKIPPEEASFPCRVRFFLHYFDPQATLDIAGKHVALPAPTPLPPHVRNAMDYQPFD